MPGSVQHFLPAHLPGLINDHKQYKGKGADLGLKLSGHWACSVCFLPHPRTNLPRRSTTHNELGPLKPITHLKITPQANLVGTFSLFSKDPLCLAQRPRLCDISVDYSKSFILFTSHILINADLQDCFVFAVYSAKGLHFKVH